VQGFELKEGDQMVVDEPFRYRDPSRGSCFFLNNACDCIILAMLGVECKDFELRVEDHMVVEGPFGTENLLVAHVFFIIIRVIA
jgi:hypothetical protein